MDETTHNESVPKEPTTPPITTEQLVADILAGQIALAEQQVHATEPLVTAPTRKTTEAISTETVCETALPAETPLDGVPSAETETEASAEDTTVNTMAKEAKADTASTDTASTDTASTDAASTDTVTAEVATEEPVTNDTPVTESAVDVEAATVDAPSPAPDAPAVQEMTEPQVLPDADATPSTESKPAADAALPKWMTGLGDCLDLVESVLTSIFVVMMIFTFLFCVATVEGDSMLPTLSDNNRLIVSRLGSHYQTGDILILESDASYTFDHNGTLIQGGGLGKRIVKRLIASGGQTVRIDFAAGIVYVDEKPLQEPYTSTLTTRDEGGFDYPFTVPEGYVFVLGDNRSISKDSRHPDVGLISVQDIIGEVLLRIYPFSEFGTVSK